MRISCFKNHYRFRIRDPRGMNSLKFGIGVNTVKTV